jgi:hypothetical protein
MADYSFNPQFANLSGLQPLPAIDVTRGANLQFRPLDKIEIQSSRPELVAEGIAGAISNIAKGALGGITARYEKKEEEAKETRKFAQEEKIARIKASQSAFEQKEQQKWELEKMKEQDKLIKGRVKDVLPPDVQFEDYESLPTDENQTTDTENSNSLTGELNPEGTTIDEDGNLIEVPSEILQEDNKTGLVSPQDANAIALNVAKQIDPATGLPLSALPEYLSASTGAGPIAPLAEMPSLGLDRVETSFIQPEQEQKIAAMSAELGKISEVKPEPEKQIPVGQAKAVKYFQSQEKANEEYAKMYPGWKAAQLPELVQTKSGPAFAVKREIISPEEQEELARKKRKEDLEISQAASAPEMSKEQNAILLSQITRLEQDKTYSKALETKDSEATIFKALSQENGLSDIAAINAFQRLVDPGVAVREGDVALIQSALAFQDKYSPQYITSQFTRGAKLPEEDRERMRILTKELARMALEKANEGPIQKYRTLTKKTGIDPDLLVMPFDIESPKEQKLGKEELIKKLNNASEEYRNSPQFQQDRDRLKELLRTN